MSDGEQIEDAQIVEADHVEQDGDGTAVDRVSPATGPVSAPAVFADLGEARHVGATVPSDLAPVLDVPVDLIVEIGRTRMTIRETLAIGRGSVIALNRLAGEPADLLVNGRLIARGEVVAIDEEFGLRVTEVVPPEGRLAAGLG
ncbi:MAG: flagellar motor switch protein FliN [Gaiella sp.]